MEAMSASISRLCQMVHDAGLRPSTEEHLQVVLETARARGRLDDNFVFFFDKVIVGFLDKFTIVKKLADDLDVRLQPTCPGSGMPATLNGIYGDNLFDALVALRLPTVAPENVHLEVVLAAQRLAQQYTVDIITHVYAQIVHKDYHVELTANAAAPHTSVGDPAH